MRVGWLICLFVRLFKEKGVRLKLSSLCVHFPFKSEFGRERESGGGGEKENAQATV